MSNELRKQGRLLFLDIFNENILAEDPFLSSFDRGAKAVEKICMISKNKAEWLKTHDIRT